MPSSRIPLYYLLVPLTAAADLWLKSRVLNIYGGTMDLIPGFAKVTVVFNRGLVFGFGSSWMPDWLPIVFTMGLMVALVRTAENAPGTMPMRHLGFACMIGGALGNVVDRLLHGFITDFMDIPPLPIFNLADVALVVGTVLVLITLFSKEGDDAHAPDSA